MRNLPIVLFVLFVNTSWLLGQQVESVTFIRGYNRADLSGQLGEQMANGVDYFKLRYTTTGSDGEPDIASGLIVVPRISDPEMHVVMYHHGTTISRDRVPSSLNLDYEAYAYFGGNGYLVLAPDYLGLGDSRGFHPYVHQATLASASVDMLKAFHQWADQENLILSENLFITGYSQGGFAGMATQKKLQQEYSGQFDVTAAAHLSGPYSLSGAMRDLMFSEQNYNFIGFVPFAILGFQEVYGNVFQDLEDIFRPGYVGMIESFYTGQINLLELTLLMTFFSQQQFGNTHPVNVFNPQLVEDMFSDHDHLLNQVLRNNDVYDWAPQAPTRLWYCGADDQVPFENSIIALAAMQQNDAPNVQGQDLNPLFNHGQCAEPAIIAALEFFKSFAPVSVYHAEDDTFSPRVFPNPANDLIRVLPGRMDEEFTVVIADLSGRVVISQQNRKYIDVSWLESGIYLLTIIGHGHNSTHKIYKR